MAIPGSVTSIGDYAFDECDKAADAFCGGQKRNGRQQRFWIPLRLFTTQPSAITLRTSTIRSTFPGRRPTARKLAARNSDTVLTAMRTSRMRTATRS